MPKIHVTGDFGFFETLLKNTSPVTSSIARHQDREYSEMKREITVFILFVIEGKYGQQIFDKLFSLGEIREVHSVHGSIDTIAKATLHRDLLSSDAEIISQFTCPIRQW